VEATLPLLLEHGRAVSTRQIAAAAGVAEGTIFRVFDSKDDLVTATIEHALDTRPFLDELRAIDPDQDLRGRLLECVTRLQARFTDVFTLMSAVGMTGPPKTGHHADDPRRRTGELMVALVAPDADRLTVSPEQLARLVRMVTFAGTHPHLSDGQLLTPDQIVSTLLDGVLKKEDRRCSGD
jgi:AcrR family transcriptional regulator